MHLQTHLFIVIMLVYILKTLIFNSWSFKCLD